MNNLPMVVNGVTHQMYDALLGVAGRRNTADDHLERDRGAVSLEQVLWFVAAGVSVAVIASILWNEIRDQANTTVETPDAPAVTP